MIMMALGGRAAEQIFYNRVSTGASDDLNKVTKIAYGLISIYGMNDKLGNLSFPPENQDSGGITTYRPYSEKTAELIDEEASKLVKKAYDETLVLLSEKKELIGELAAKLLKEETLGHDEITEILGPRPFQSDTYKEFLDSTKEFADKFGEDSVDIVHNDEAPKDSNLSDTKENENDATETEAEAEIVDENENEGESGNERKETEK